MSSSNGRLFHYPPDQVIDVLRIIARAEPSHEIGRMLRVITVAWRDLPSSDDQVRMNEDLEMFGVRSMRELKRLIWDAEDLLEEALHAEEEEEDVGDAPGN